MKNEQTLQFLSVWATDVTGDDTLLRSDLNHILVVNSFALH